MTSFKSLSRALSSPHEVTVLKLKLTQNKIPSEIFTLSNLKELYLESDQILDLTASWEELPLCTLSLQAKAIKMGLSDLFKIKTLTNLKILNTQISSLTLPLGNFVSPLKFLTLKNTELSQLPEEISILKSVENIFLPQNKLSSLPQSFKELKCLKWLNLDHNNFYKFPDLLAKLPALNHLSIDGNLFSQDEKDRVFREYHLSLN